MNLKLFGDCKQSVLNRDWCESWENYLSVSKDLFLVAPSLHHTFINDFDKYVHGVLITCEDDMILKDTRSILCEILRILKRIQPIGTM